MYIEVSAIICTHNRAKYLRKAIRSLADQSLRKSLYEIIIIDNGSTDNTKRIVLEELASVSNLRYVYEPVLGLSQARNTGWKNAEGEYVAYLDDDAIAGPQWLEKILLTFNSVKPVPGAVCGKVEPIWEAPRPGWVPDSMLGAFTIVDWSQCPIILNKKQFLPGANFALPIYLIRKVGGFKTKLGRQGNKLLSMEETLLRREIEAMGYYCYYNPQIAVRHHILASRLTQRWFLGRWYWQGISEAVLQVYLESLYPSERIRRVIPLARRLLLPPGRLPRLLLATNCPDRFAAKCLDLSRLGYMVGMLGIAK